MLTQISVNIRFSLIQSYLFLDKKIKIHFLAPHELNSKEKEKNQWPVNAIACVM